MNPPSTRHLALNLLALCLLASAANATITINEKWAHTPTPGALAAWAAVESYYQNVFSSSYANETWNISLDWKPLSGGIAEGGPSGDITLGSVLKAQPGALADRIQDNVYYESALANHLTKETYVSGENMSVAFNSTVAWDYSTNSTASDKESFFTTAIHELAHGLGFISHDNGTAGGWVDDQPYVFDYYLGLGKTAPVSLIGKTNQQLAAAFVSNNVYWTGSNGTTAFGSPIKIYSPNPYEDGSSMSHLDYSVDTTQSLLMYPADSGKPALYSYTPLELGMWEDMGYDVGTTPVVVITPGVFSGLVGEGLIGTGDLAAMTAFFANNGFLSVTASANRNFTGQLRLEGKNLPFKGKFDPYGGAEITVKRTGGNATVSLTFVAATETTPVKITGTVNTGGDDMSFDALRAYTGTAPDLTGKRYTIILPAPDPTAEGSFGHGYATLVVAAAKGTGTLAGKLADGTAFTASVQIEDDLSVNLLLPVYVPVYASSAHNTPSSGMLFGEALLPKIEPADFHDVTGSLGWLRPASDTAKMFPSGFLKPLDPVGETYLLTKNQSFLTGTEATGNFTITMDPASTPPLVEQTGTWPKSNIPLLDKPVSSKMSLTFAGATGVFKGTFQRTTETGKKVSSAYEGVLLANPITLSGTASAVRAAGFYSTGAESVATESLPVEMIDTTPTITAMTAN